MNPILPLWEYIPDGEPRVFGDRVYLYGSHDRVGHHEFCDGKLKVWSAPLSDLNHWVCHGDSFRTRPGHDRGGDVPWTDHDLYAPDVIETRLRNAEGERAHRNEFAAIVVNDVLETAYAELRALVLDKAKGV